MKLPISPRNLAVLAGITLASPAYAMVNIDYVSVGNAGNAADPATGSLYGAVAYAYKIAKNETTISQYAEFLNAVAKTDTYGLYNADMARSYNNGISRSGLDGSFNYTVNPGSGNKPITWVSWFDAARFVNWLHNGQPTGAQNAYTTEDGAYTLNGTNSGVSVSKNVGATVWIPSESEWYKAAYYDPNKDAVGGYWLHATQGNSIAGNTVGAADSANYFDGDYVGSGNSSVPSSNGLTDVGAYGLNSESAYGTNDQAGNVMEWNDAVIGSYRGVRGSAWDSPAFYLPATWRNSEGPTWENQFTGFRVASIPEPSTLVLTVLFSTCLITRRKR
jgi:formylglycine-generating enzyme required for sulfatase activity